ncbi:MAG: hypothetical protein EXS09_04145 [Gemmataceae bacterium]|nr:hypothetical protein [Gemmataceae bacterium]
MATTFVIACPDCSKQVKVSDEHVGKRIRCKGCDKIFPVQAPTAKGSAPKPSAPKGKGPPAPPKTKAPEGKPLPEPETKPNPNADEEDTNDYSLAQINDGMPRCPFCAKEMSAVDARICLNCGYNTRTRQRPVVKTVYQHTGVEVFLWWLPGILTVLFMIGCLVWYLVSWMMIEDWMAESVFEDEPGPPRTYLVGLSPGAFRLYQGLLLAGLYVPCTRFVIKRLVKDNKPKERKLGEDD